MALRSGCAPQRSQRRPNDTAWSPERYSQMCAPSRYSSRGGTGSVEKKELRAPQW